MRRAIGIIRVSDAKDRDGDTFLSPRQQETRIGDKCDALNLRLVDIKPEIGVSGGKPLVKRTGLLWGVEAIEAGEADVLVVAYFDRLVRELRVQHEVVSRVERAGGEVLTVDFGRLSEETAAQWLSGTMVGAVHEYYRRQAKERTDDSKADAVARGIPPFPNIPPGFKREIVGRTKKGKPTRGPFVADEPAASVMLEAFEMRDRLVPFAEIRHFLRGEGIDRSQHAIEHLMQNRAYVGELHYGDLVNLKAHPAIIPRALFERVQRLRVKKGRQAKSDLLLARLDILRCEAGVRMVAGRQTVRNQRGDETPYAFYRCPPTSDCKHKTSNVGAPGRRMTISAPLVENLVEDAVKALLADVEGRASIEDHAREAEDALEQAQEKLGSAIRAFAGVEDEVATQERLAELRAERDQAQEVVDQLGGSGSAVTVTGADWDRLTLAEKRDLIRAVVEEVTISPGRGPERVSIKLFVE